MRLSKVLVAAMLTLAVATGPSFANLGSTVVPRLSQTGSFTAPLGFQIFCLQNAAHCRGGGASEVALTRNILSTIQAVNTRVNRSIRPTSERTDVWSVGVSAGDCEDYALTKRAELIRAGLPASALRIAAAKTRQGIGHAVLVVRTNEGDLVLDNLVDTVKRSDQTGLRWVAMTSADGRSWQRVS